MKTPFKLLLTIGILFSVLSVGAQKVDKTMPISCRMVESEMVRFPNSWMFDFHKTPKWSYTNGLECNAILLVSETYKEKREKYLEYAKGFSNEFINPDGTIKNYALEEYNIDHVAPGPMLLRLYDITGDERYVKAAGVLRKQLDTHPRTGDGGFWHKKIYPNQMWLDGLFMAEPFYAEYAKRFGKKEDFQDIIKQFELMAKAAYDEKSGLYRHAYDYSKSAFWADKTTGLSQHVWGRAMGWFVMAIVETLEFMPENEPNREKMIEILAIAAKGIEKYKDSKTGLFYQVMELPDRKGNYLEATCASMFAYSFMKGARKGYLPAQYQKAGLDIYDAIVKHLIKEDAQGVLSLTNCCSVAGVGPESNKRRDGTFDYYMSEPIRDNDPKGVGPFILASLEAEGLRKK